MCPVLAGLTFSCEEPAALPRYSTIELKKSMSVGETNLPSKFHGSDIGIDGYASLAVPCSKAMVSDQNSEMDCLYIVMVYGG